MEIYLVRILLVFLILYLLYPSIVLSIRSRLLRKLAEEFGFQYIKHGENNLFKRWFSEKNEHNILSGTYGAKTYVIKDICTKSIITSANGMGGSGRVNIRITSINNHNYGNHFFPYLSVNKIRGFIKGEENIQQYSYDIKNFNRGLFILFIISGIVISFITYAYLINRATTTSIYLIILIINIFFVILGFYLARYAGTRRGDFIIK